jgi:hypothetical protein
MHAWIDALHIDTGMISWTVTITIAADHITSFKRITIVAAAASTVSNMIVCKTFGIATAIVRKQARVYAIVVHARFVEHAFRISLTFYGVAGNIRITLMSLFT